MCHKRARRAWHGWVLEAWYGGQRRSLLQRGFVALMSPLGWLVGRVAAGRRRHAARASVGTSGLPPVIVIGNLTVGGTGKTPVVAWMAAALRARGQRVGLVSRGYQRQSGRHDGAARRVRPGDSPAQVGDEPAWLASTTGCPMAVGHDRRAALALLAGEVDVVIADDGLQHHALPRWLEVIVVDVTRPAPLGNGRCLPAGPLREPADFVGPGHVVLLNHGVLPMAAQRAAAEPAWAKRATVLHFGVRPTEAVHLRTGERRALSTFGMATAVAGIGNPQRFFDSLRSAGVILVATRAFPDHHAYEPGDFAALPGADDGHGATPVLLTTKDAVKCASFAANHWWSVEAELVFAPGDGERLLECAFAALDETN